MKSACGVLAAPLGWALAPRWSCGEVAWHDGADGAGVGCGRDKKKRLVGGGRFFVDLFGVGLVGDLEFLAYVEVGRRQVVRADDLVDRCLDVAVCRRCALG